MGGVQSKQVDQYDLETDSWLPFFPSLRHCRVGPLPPQPRLLSPCQVAHGVVVQGDTILVAGGSAKANANFGPGLYEMESCRVSRDNTVKPDWRIAGTDRLKGASHKYSPS